MRPRKTTSLVLCLAAGLVGAACGSDEEGKPIPSDSATALESQLDNVDARLANGSVGACNDVLRDDGGNVGPVEQLISNMPDDVDGDVVSALSDGFDRLFELVQERCEELQRERDEQQEQDEDEPEITIPEKTETETGPPETVPPETETQTEPDNPETTPDTGGETPPGQGGENPGQGGGGGAIVPGGDE